MSPASYKHWGKEEVRLHPVGTGPFKLARWEQNQIIVLEKNPHYFKPGLPYLDRIELRIMKEGVTRVDRAADGGSRLRQRVPREHVERLARDPQLQVFKGEDTQRTQCYFNLRNRLSRMSGCGRRCWGMASTDRPSPRRRSWGWPSPYGVSCRPGARDHIDFGEQFAYDPRQGQGPAEGSGV